MPLSIALIFLLLFDAFGSVKSALLIVVNMPFALIGGILALWATGIPLSVSAAIGFIALFGQAVLNGVVMVTYFNQLRDEGSTVREAVMQGSLVRLRTVLMTALLAMLGLAAHGAFPRHRLRDAAPAGDGGDRRADLRDAADALRAADALPRVLRARGAPAQRRRGSGRLRVEMLRERLASTTAGGWCLAALLAAFLVAGTVGHDPWKPDEAYTFGMVFHILQSGDWVVPTLGGEPFMEKPPLYYLAASATARLFAPLLPLHDGARLASTFFMFVTLGFTALAARRLFGAGHGWRAALLLLGCIGLPMYAHTMITDVALLTGFAIATFGLALALERPFAAGALLGTGVGIGFMSKGLVEPSMIGLAVIALPLAFREWRRREYLICLVWAFAFALPWLLAWPIALWLRDPALFREWFWLNNLGRYFGFADLGAYDEPLYFTRTLPWFSLPAGALAVYAFAAALWWRRLRMDRGLQLALALTAGILAVLGTSASVRELYALPVLVPLSIAGSVAVDRFPPRAALAATAIMAIVAAGVAALAWWIWLHGMVNGHPPIVPYLARYLPSDYTFTFHRAFASVAFVATALWIAVWVLRPAESWLPLWTANVAFGWCVVMTLLLPWLDDAKSFRAPFQDLATRLPQTECIESVGLGEGQRGMLDYLARRTTLRIERGAPDCPYVLVQTGHDGLHPPLPRGRWALLWQGARDGESRERFLFYGPSIDAPRLAFNELPSALPRAHLRNPRHGDRKADPRAVALRRRGDAHELSKGVENGAAAPVGRDGH